MLKRDMFLFFFIVFVGIALFFISPEIRNYALAKYIDIANWLFPSDVNRNAELLKIILSVLAGIGVFVGIYVSLWRAKTTEESVRLQSEAIRKQGQQIELSVKSQIDERFSKAIEHLGSDKEPVLLGGISELHQIAKENPFTYAEVVFNILCSYVRSNANIYKQKAEDINYTAIQTIIDYIFKKTNDNLNPYIKLKADLSHSNLRGANLDNCDFSEANFSFSFMPSLKNVSLIKSDLSKTDFTVLNLCNVNASKATLFNAKFKFSNLTDVDFSDCESFTVSFVDCDIHKTFLNKVKSYKSNFYSCVLNEVSFEDAEIISTSFSCSLIYNVDFINIPVLYESDFRAVGFNNTRINSYMSKCKFNGSEFTSRTYKYFFEERALSRISMKSEILNTSNSYTSDCDFGDLTQVDYDQLIENYKQANS